MQVAFVRHGRATVAENVCIGHTDVPLSPDGADSVRALAARVWPNASRIVSSDLRRASESAAILAEALGCGVHHDRRLREMDFGAWDGRPWAEVERDDARRFQEWADHWVSVAPPGGECAADVARRAGEWISEILTARDDRLIVVSHAGWIRAALCQLVGRDLSRMFEFPADHGRATLVSVTRSGCVILAGNVPTLDVSSC